MSEFISVYYYDFVCIIILVYSYRENQERCCHSQAVFVQRLRNNQWTEHVEVSSWLGELESMFYKHLRSPHLDVLRLSNDPNEGCTDIVMSCLYVIRNKKPQSKRVNVLRGPVDKQVSLFCKGLLLPIS
jgi:hypothetical protein